MIGTVPQKKCSGPGLACDCMARTATANIDDEDFIRMTSARDEEITEKMRR